MVSVTYTIPDNKFDDFKAGFLKIFPVPTNRDGSPKFTENAWIKQCGLSFFVDNYKEGKVNIARENANTDSNIMS